MPDSPHAPPTGRHTGADRSGRVLRSDTRGVQWTLEAFLAVLLLLSALVVVAAVLPVGSQQAEAELAGTQLQQAGDDVLRLAEAEGNLTAALLYWNTTDGTFVGAEADIRGQSHYVTVDSNGNHPLASLLADTLGERPIAYNVHIEYETRGAGSGVTEQRPVVYQGPPGGDSVTASTTVLLFENGTPAESAGDCTLAELDDNSACGSETFYAPNVGPTSDRYNTVQIQVELWRA